MSFSNRRKKFGGVETRKSKSVNVEKTINSIQGYKEAEEYLPNFHISDVQLELLTDEEKEQIQEVAISQIGNETLDESSNLYSGSLGASSISKCKTCNLPNIQCKTGHIGIIRFPKGVKVYLPIVFETILVKLLNCVCYIDGSYYLSLPTIVEKLSSKKDLPVQQKLTELKKQSEGARCRNESEHVKRHYSVKKFGRKYKQLVYTYGTDKTVYEADIGEIAKLLLTLEAEDDPSTKYKGNKISQFLGLYKLRAYITSSILVPPDYLRPSYECKGEIQDHDITKIFKNIIKSINDYTKSQNTEDKVEPSTLSKNLFFLIESLYKDNGSTYSNVKTNNIDKEMRGKRGFVRRFMFGKVNEGMARMIIEGNNKLRADQVTIPANLKYILTVPVLVTSDNFDEIVRMMEEGSISKIKYNHDPNGGSVPALKGNTLPVIKGNTYISEGDVAYRHLMDDDIVLIGRQPTLWIGNILAFRCILDHRPNRNVMEFNDVVAGSFNADHDGDEMHLSVPHTLEGQIDAREKLYVTNNLITRHKSTPTLSPILNNVAAFFYITKDMLTKTMFDLCFNEIYTADYTEFCNRLVFNGFMDIRKIRGNLVYDKIIPGKLLLSALFPPDYYYNQGGIYIKNGILLKGDNISARIKGIIYDIAVRYSNEAGINFINCSVFSSNIYIAHYGLTVSLQDYYLDFEAGDVRERIDALIDKVNNEIVELEKSKRDTKNNLEKNNIEEKIKSKLNSLSFLLFRIINDDDKNKVNSFFDMVNSKSKGSVINIVQLLASVGQPYFSNERPTYVVPYFNNKSKFFGIKTDSDYNIEAKGFVRESYYTGIPMKIIGHSALSAREGQIANVDIVPEAGDLNRNLTNSMLNVKSTKTGRVKVGNTLLQEQFGGDGLDPKRTFNITYRDENVQYFIDINSTIERINNKYGVFKTDRATLLKDNNPPLIISDREIRDDIALITGTLQRGFVEYLYSVEGKVALDSDDDGELDSFENACKILGKQYIIGEEDGYKQVDIQAVKTIVVNNLRAVMKENNVDLLLRKDLKVYVPNNSIYSVIGQLLTVVDTLEESNMTWLG